MAIAKYQHADPITWIEEQIRQISPLPESACLIDNILTGQSIFAKRGYAKALKDMYYYLVILDQGDNGFSYTNSPPDDIPIGMIGQHALCGMQETPMPLRIALLDAIAGIRNRLHGDKATLRYRSEGTIEEKAKIRSRLVTSPIKRGERVVLIGAVSEFAHDIIAKGGILRITDLSDQRSCTQMAGIPLEIGHAHTLDALKNADRAIVTGATLATGTIHSIMANASHRTKIDLYMETGHNLAPELKKLGANRIVAETFPFYDMPGMTEFKVYEDD